MVPVDVTVCSHGIRLQPRAEPAGVRAGRARVLHAEGDPQPAAASPRHPQEIPAETDPLLRLRDRAGCGFLRQRYLEGGREGWGIPAPRVLPRVGEVFLGAFPRSSVPSAPRPDTKNAADHDESPPRTPTGNAPSSESDIDISSPNVSHDESIAKDMSMKDSGSDLSHRPKRRRFHESYNFNMKCPTPGCNSLGNPNSGGIPVSCSGIPA